MSSKSTNGCVGCLKSCLSPLKILNLLFHGFLAFLGICIVLLSGLALCNEVTYQMITTLNYFLNFRQCFGVVILIGFFLSLVGCFGVISTFQGHHRRLSICLVFYVVLVILSVTIMLLTWSDKNINFDSKINNSIRNFKDKKMSENLDSFQTLLGCCGSKGPMDYEKNSEMFGTGQTPGSCCDISNPKSTQPNCIGNVLKINLTSAYQNGCYDKMNYLIWPIIYGICIGLISLMMLTNIFVILLIFACEGSSCLGNGNNKTKKVYVDGDVDGEKIPLEANDEDEEEEEEDGDQDVEEGDEEERDEDGHVDQPRIDEGGQVPTEDNEMTEKHQ